MIKKIFKIVFWSNNITIIVSPKIECFVLPKYQIKIEKKIYYLTTKKSLTNKSINNNLITNLKFITVKLIRAKIINKMTIKIIKFIKTILH